MEGRRRNNMKGPRCLPSLITIRNNNSNNNTTTNSSNNRLSPISLLERFRETVFRLIMLNAISKNPHHDAPINVRRMYSPVSDQQYHSDAVAECIDFIKKSASTNNVRDSTASNSSLDATAAEVVLSSLPAIDISVK
ncbi:hypothetical protein BVC80_8873g12 [Macleaya cordata]|uniref:Uncharacterized protein n=1 Tax=Macleaya cordata TaxID=56857 RepID=A0A200Q377_MACCD|nr:hypothetical protein BVC80_8873g12 [Macleaya cordata]